MDIARMLTWAADRYPGRRAVGGPRPLTYRQWAARTNQTQQRPGEVSLGVMPLFHTMGVRTLLASICVAGTWVPQARFDAAAPATATS